MSRNPNDMVFTVEPTSKKELERLAEELIIRFDPKAISERQPLDVRAFSDLFVTDVTGWELDVQESLPANVLGYCDPKTKAIVIPSGTYALLKEDGRSRFTIIHECAHAIKHGTQMLHRMVTMSETHDKLYRYKRNEIASFIDPEWQADYLAGCLLMPRWHVQDIINKTRTRFEAITQVMNTFVVSRTAAEVRVKYVLQNNC